MSEVKAEAGIEIPEKRLVQVIGWLGCILAVLMFLSFLDQARLNLTGSKGSLFQPSFTFINCAAWLMFGAGLRKKNWQIIISNSFGIFCSAITFVTAKWGNGIIWWINETWGSHVSLWLK